MKRFANALIIVFSVALMTNVAWGQTKTWNGSYSNSWNMNENWTGSNGATNSIPTASDTVIIESATNSSTLNTDGVCGVIIIKTGSLSLSSSTLTVTTSGGLSGNVKIGVSGNSGATLNGNTGILLVAGDLGKDGTSSAFNANTSTLTLTGSSPTISPAFIYYNLIVSISGTLAISGSLDVNGNLSIISGTLSINSSGSVTGVALKTLSVSSGGTYKTNLSTFGATGFGTYTLNGTVVYGSTSVVAQIIDQTKIYTNLTLTGGMTKTAGGDLTINGNFLISSSATYNDSGFTSNVKGTWTKNGTFTTTGTVNLSGVSNQNVNATTFNNLTLNNTGGVTLSGAVTISGTLTMNSGNIALGGKTLTIGSSVSSTGTLALFSGCMTGSGLFKRWFGTNTIAQYDIAGQFPFGTAANNRCFYFSGTPTTGGTITVQYTDASGTTAINFNEHSQNFVNRHNASWTVIVNSLVGTGFSLGIRGTGLPGINAITDLNISGATGATAGIYTATTGTTTNPIINRIGLDQAGLAGTFYFASTSSSPLPVQLTSFIGISNQSGALLTWKTATEINCYGFEVEKRVISEQLSAISNWSKVGFVSGSGTSNAPHEYIFIDENATPARYVYRLKQLDNDGSFAYYGSVEVEIGTAPKVLTLANYPNPFNPATTVEFSLPANGYATLKVFNIRGQEIATLFNGIAQAGYFNKVIFDGSRFASGVYYYSIEFGTQHLVKRMLMLK